MKQELIDKLKRAAAEKRAFLLKNPRRITSYNDLSLIVKGHLSTMHEKLAKFMEKSYLGTATPKKAIKAKCLDCVCHEEPVARIRDCKSFICPLHKYRPYKTAGEK